MEDEAFQIGNLITKFTEVQLPRISRSETSETSGSDGLKEKKVFCALARIFNIYWGDGALCPPPLSSLTATWVHMRSNKSWLFFLFLDLRVIW